MASIIFLIVVFGVVLIAVWWLTREDEVDKIIRERIDYDAWLRHHNLTQEKED